MLFRQTANYQNIGRGGRDCHERWGVIRNHIRANEHGCSLDVGSAEGFFARHLAEATGGTVVSVEGSEHVYRRQLAYCRDLIARGKIILLHLELDEANVDTFADAYDYCLLLSVVHWLENPDVMLLKLSRMTRWLFFEMPELNDPIAWNQGFLARLRREFESIPNYLTAITGMTVEEAAVVSSHTPPFRTLYVLRTQDRAR